MQYGARPVKATATLFQLILFIMQPAQQQLNLKDIHLPDAVSWWPPAIGYWLILAIFIVLMLLFFGIRYLRRKSLIKRQALTEFARIKSTYQADLNQKALVTSLSKLLRRAAISAYPVSECASLSGKSWLNWLDKQLPKSDMSFSKGPGYLLTEFIYSDATHTNDINDLLKLTQQWLQQLPAKGKLS